MFLDREPYIRFWRPTYRVIGPSIRRVKALFAALVPGRTAKIMGQVAASVAATEQQLASLQALVVKLSAAQERLSPILGQVAGTVAATKQQLAEMHNQTAKQLAGLQALVTQLSAEQERISPILGQVAATVAATEQQLAEKHNQLRAQNSAQWEAIEHLLVSFMANSSRTEGLLNMTSGSQENHRDAVARKAAI
jgi:ABC-type transporter Mla subunit MlaD